MSTSGIGAKRVRMPSTASTDGSPSPAHKQPRSDGLPSPSPSSPRSQSRSPARSPSRSPSRSPVPPPPARSQSRSRSRDRYSHSRSRDSRSGSEEADGQVWRPHSYRERGEQGRGGGEYSVCIGDYDQLFTCRACGRMLSSPVYECSAGHLTCSRCRREIGADRCSRCREPVARSRAVEGFVATISFARRNQEFGCDEFLPHREMRAHERACHHEPCFCPAPRCGFAGPTYALQSHLAAVHSWDVVPFRYGESFQVHAALAPETVFRCHDYGELFHIVVSREACGTALSMVCIRPDNACKQELTYELKLPPPAEAGGGRHRLQISSTVWNTSLRYGIGEGADVFLLIPDKLPGNEADRVVEVCIRKAEEPGATRN